MMSKTWLIAAAWLLTSVAASAQEPEAWRPKYVNLSFVSQKLDFGEGEKLKSRFGAAFTTGRSYYLHKKPVAGMIRFGIDATWIDLSYANYSREETYDDGYGTEIEKLTAHQAEIGMQVRNSATPVQHADIGDTLLRSGGMQAEFRSNTAGRLRLTDQQGWFSDTSIAPGTVVVPIPERSLWVRAELRAEDGSMIALTNPIYIQHPLTTQSLLPE